MVMETPRCDPPARQLRDWGLFCALSTQEEVSLLDQIAELIIARREVAVIESLKRSHDQRVEAIIRSHDQHVDALMFQLEKALGPTAAIITTVSQEDTDRANEFRRRLAKNLEYLCFRIPTPHHALPISELDLPNRSGIYVAWDRKTLQCHYVGKAESLKNRVRGSHERLQASDIISFNECAKSKLRFCEALAIGILQPSRNIAKP